MSAGNLSNLSEFKLKFNEESKFNEGSRFNDRSGVKTNSENEGPIDTFLYKICENISEFFYKTGHTPNTITTYSFILGLASAYFYYHNHLFLFAICFIVSYLFDCLDGYMARKYNMKSDFGEYYDSISDGTVIVLLLYIVYIKHYHKLNSLLLFIFATFVILLNLELSCQEKIINNENPTVFKKTLRELCPETIVSKDNSYFSYLRWFSPATFNLVFMLILINLNLRKI